MRSGANPGELVVVSGAVGGAARVLDLIQSGVDAPENHLLNRPQPRVKLGRTLVGFAGACIDISDGLLADLGHVLEASGCGARIYVEKLPQHAVLAGLDSPKAVIGTITLARSSWVDALKARPDVTLLEVTPANRAACPELILAWLRQNRAKGRGPDREITRDGP